MDDEKKLQLKKKTELLAIVLGDLLILFGVSVLALWLRFEFHYKDITPMFLERMYKYMPIHLVCSILLFYFCGMYKSIWRYASISEVGNIITGCFLTTMLQWVVMWKISYRMPVSFHCMTFVFLVGFITLDRFAYRIIVEMKSRYFVTGPGNTENVMIVGAGDAGRVMLKEFHESQYIEGKVVCFIDDSPEKIGKALNGVPIVGDRNYILQAVDEYSVDEIIVAIPTISAKERSKILHICQETQCSVRMLPGVYQLINGEVNINSLRKVEVEDLLGRDQIKVDLNQIMGYVSGKRIMVTGGGGSIGSELCRQIASKKPEMLIIVDIYENNAYEIQQELLYKYPELNLVVLIASVRNTNRINEIFKTYKPQIVYHAAAHKHVPLMETSPNEAIKNNVFGTLKTARAAGENGVEKFVMISTDKAVNPTNIMGASKRICEMVIQTMNKEYKTDFAPVGIHASVIIHEDAGVELQFRLHRVGEGSPGLIGLRHHDAGPAALRRVHVIDAVLLHHVRRVQGTVVQRFVAYAVAGPVGQVVCRRGPDHVVHSAVFGLQGIVGTVQVYPRFPVVRKGARLPVRHMLPQRHIGVGSPDPFLFTHGGFSFRLVWFH